MNRMLLAVTAMFAMLAPSALAQGVTVCVFQGKDAKGEPMLAARQSFVTTGATRGDQVAVLSGVKAGEKVLSAGGIKLHNGSPVIVNNSVQPTDNPNPAPPDE